MFMKIKESIQTVQVLDSSMEIFLFIPDCNEPVAGLVLAQHIPGHSGIENDAFTLAAARRFAEQGFAVAVPFIFHWWPKGDGMDSKREQSRDDWTVQDMKSAFDLLQKQKEVDANRIGITGHCWGGRVAWLAACHIPECKALVVFYGGNIKKALGEGNAPPIELANNITCPVTGFFGNEDANPSPEDVDDYSAALSDAGISHEFYQYDGAGHAFQNFPVAERYHEQASEDAWEKVMLFLKETLS